MLVKGDERNRGKWKMGIVVEIITGRDGIARAARIKTGTGSYLERALQQLYPLELLCDREPQGAQNVLSVNAAELAPRRETRQAARDALRRIAAFSNDESNLKKLWHLRNFALYQIRDNAIILFVFK